MTRIRLQFDFTPEEKKRIQDIKDKSGSTSYRQLAERALELYDWFDRNISEGSRFFTIDGTGKRTYYTLIF